MNGAILSINKAVGDYTRRRSIDAFVRDEKRMLRSRSRSSDALPLKTLSFDDVKITKSLEVSPLIIAGVKSPTPIQKLLMDDLMADGFEKFGSLAYKASCGSGKTMCGLLAIYRKKVKTMVISTRSAVIDQWKSTINSIYPSLDVYVGGDKLTRGRTLNDYDVWLLTPQYLNINDRIINLEIRPGLIIYDEIHSMLSTLNYQHSSPREKHIAEFANVLKLPFVRAYDWGELPYMLSLSATYPKDSVVELIFGRVRSAVKDPITDIPIPIFDWRRECPRRGKIDSRWKKPTDAELVRCFTVALFDRKFRDRALLNRDPTLIGPYTRAIVSHSQLIIPSTKFKGIVMTGSVDSSVWASLFIHKQFNASVMLLRTTDEYSFFFERDKHLEFTLRDDVTVKDITIGEKSKDYSKFIDHSEIIVSTYHRVKEGFSVSQLVWGICTEFVWSPLTRVQIAGRIRRSTDDAELNSYPRQLFVCSGSIPNDLFVALKKHRQAKITYDQEFEDELFARENYYYINDDKSA